MPMNSSSLTILGFLLLSAPALAEDIYRFTVDQRQGDEVVPLGAFLGQGSVKGTVILDGGKYRLELAPDPEDVRPFEVVISHDGGGREIALNPRNHTYFEPKESEITSPLLLLLPSPGDRSVSRVTMTASAQPDEVPGVRRQEIKLSYDITLVIPPPPNMPPGFKGHSETVRGKV